MTLTLVSAAVLNYRNHKVSTINDTVEYLKPYVEQYFEKADKHFERLMDIIINIPDQFKIKTADSNYIKIIQGEVIYTLSLNPELTETEISESMFVLELIKRTRLCV